MFIYIWVILVTLIVSQGASVVERIIRHKRFETAYLFAYGGMPSSHSATVSALSATVYFEQGWSLLFLVVLIFSIIVMRDAVGIRAEIGKHAKFMNLKQHTKFNQEVGHSVPEMLVGILLGVVIACLFYLL